jgi:hypothetical protein
MLLQVRQVECGTEAVSDKGILLRRLDENIDLDACISFTGLQFKQRSERGAGKRCSTSRE